MSSITVAGSADLQTGRLCRLDGLPLKQLPPGTLGLLLLQRTSAAALELQTALDDGDLLRIDRLLGRNRKWRYWLSPVCNRRSAGAEGSVISCEIRYGPHLVAQSCLIGPQWDSFALSFPYNGEKVDAHPWSVTASNPEAARQLQLIVVANAPILSDAERALSSLSFHTMKDRCSQSAPFLKRPEKATRWPIVELDPGMFVGGEVAKAALLMEWAKYKRSNTNRAK